MEKCTDIYTCMCVRAIYAHVNGEYTITYACTYCMDILKLYDKIVKRM